jgi:sRNA-binding carbon storage regulator CsrA
LRSNNACAQAALFRRPSAGEGETIVIGDEITVTVIEVRGDQVRLGIKAPRCVRVAPEEVAGDHAFAPG